MMATSSRSRRNARREGKRQKASAKKKAYIEAKSEVYYNTLFDAIVNEQKRHSFPNVEARQAGYQLSKR